MTTLEKAKLEALDRQGKVTETIPVQFNPASMRLQMTNSIDGAKSRGRQTQQYNGTSSTTLSLDLELDTADEGTTERPLDVRTRSAKVAQFLLPGGPKSKQAPPRVRFRWGTFELVGVMSSLTEELSLFAPSGAPLRAKLSIQIKEQDPKFEALERGAGANESNSPPDSGEGDEEAPGGPGTSGGGLADTSVPALDGETPADFLARNGLAPEAWRALGSALDALSDGIELEAGLSVEFASSLSIGAGLGVSAGFRAEVGTSVEAALGLGGAGPPSGSTGRSTGLQAGFALSAAGGTTAAFETAKAAGADAASGAARASFGAEGDRGPAAASGGSRAPLTASTSSRTQPALPAPPAPLPPKADPRATTFGFGVPLRDRIGVPGSDADGYVVIGRALPTEISGRSRRPGTTAPWEQLPAPATSALDRRPTASAGCGCGCGGGCGGSSGGAGHR